MSELKRLKRIIKSVLPSFKKKRKRYYNFDDAKSILNELGMQMSPEVLGWLIEDESLLDDFCTSLYYLEDDIDRDDIITEFSRIDEQYEPKVYQEGGQVLFTIFHRKKEIVFAEYELPGWIDDSEE